MPVRSKSRPLRFGASLALIFICGFVSRDAEARGRRFSRPAPIISTDVPLPPQRPDELKPQPEDKKEDVVNGSAGAEIPKPPPRPADITPQSVPPEPAQTPSQVIETPLPPSRPTDITPPSDVSTQTPPQVPPPPVAPPDDTCPRVLASDKLVVKAAPPVTGAGGCGIAAPVHLEAVILASGTHVPLQPPALIRCNVAEALGDWIRDDIAPLAIKAGSPLKRIISSDGYECRSRNHVAGAKLSEHGIGNAFDLPGVELENGTRIFITPESQPRDFMEGLKASACARFHTVLGPGSDAYHEAHLHVDLAQRRNDYRICQWEMK